MNMFSLSKDVSPVVLTWQDWFLQRRFAMERNMAMKKAGISGISFSALVTNIFGWIWKHPYDYDLM